MTHSRGWCSFNGKFRFFLKIEDKNSFMSCIVFKCSQNRFKNTVSSFKSVSRELEATQNEPLAFEETLPNTWPLLFILPPRWPCG